MMSVRPFSLSPGFIGAICLFVLCCPLVESVFGQEEKLRPRQVVELWLQVYPSNMERAADLTTTSFREGVSKEEWITNHGAFLKNLQMKYVRGKVVNEEIKKDEARVIVNAHIKTLMGDHPQDEAYFLRKGTEGSWLVDKVEVYMDNFNRLP